MVAVRNMSQDAIFRLLQLDVLWNVVQRRIINVYMDYTCVWSLNFANMATLRNFDVLSLSKDLIQDLIYLNNTFFVKTITKYNNISNRPEEL